jgi:hypothetical protein
MTPEQKREGALESFEEFLLLGVPVEQAMVRAAMGNELKPDIFYTVAEKILGDLQAYRERLLSHAVQQRFRALLKDEVRKCRARTGRYTSVGLLWQRATELLQDGIECSLGRQLTNTEMNEVREAWSNQLRLRLKSELAR